MTEALTHRHEAEGNWAEPRTATLWFIWKPKIAYQLVDNFGQNLTKSTLSACEVVGNLLVGNSKTYNAKITASNELLLISPFAPVDLSLAVRPRLHIILAT